MDPIFQDGTSLKLCQEVALPGCLYVVATPIGNLAESSYRMLSILETCTMIACEDTRITSKLLNHYNIPKKQLITYRDDNEQLQAEYILQQLHSGQSVALVTDAGTPAISDPGFRIVRLCRKHAIRVVPIAGPCAITACLSASGLPSDQFLFVGFLPAKTAARKAFFLKESKASYTLVLYESPHRIIPCLEDILQILGPERTVCVAREVTKRFETFLVGTIDTVLKQLEKQSSKGEFVIIIAKEGFLL